MSTFYKALSERLLYRVIELGDDPKYHLKRLATTKDTVSRLSNPKDKMSMHIRDLRITHLNTADETLNETEVERIIGSVARLQYFRYRARRYTALFDAFLILTSNWESID